MMFISKQVTIIDHLFRIDSMKDGVTECVKTEIPWKYIQDCLKQNQFPKTHTKYFTNLAYANVTNRDLSINKSHITLIPFRENSIKHLNQ